MYYSQDDDQNTQKMISVDPADNDDATAVKFSRPLLFYEGFIKIHDEGYSKTLYINSYAPYDKFHKRYFFLTTQGQEAWILLLVKALAKYYGSYDKLSEASFEALCNVLFGSQPTHTNDPGFKKTYLQTAKATSDDERKNVQNSEVAELEEVYDQVSSALNSKRFILFAQRKLRNSGPKDQTPSYIN